MSAGLQPGRNAVTKVRIRREACFFVIGGAIGRNWQVTEIVRIRALLKTPKTRLAQFLTSEFTLVNEGVKN